jgi:CheY-like chemotaxis protein
MALPSALRRHALSSRGDLGGREGARPASSEQERCGHGSCRSRTPLAILVVADNPVDMTIIRRVLDAHRLPYALRVIADGEAALRFFDQLATAAPCTPPALLFLDLTLPRVSGREWLQRILTMPACARRRMVVTATDELHTRIEASR